MKKIFINTLIVFLILSFFVGYSYFMGFEEWKKQTWAGFSILSILNTLGIFVFVIFGISALTNKYFPKFIISRYFIDNVHDITYIVGFCIILTLMIPLIISKAPLTWFIWRYYVTAFIYLFGVVTICIKIFFNK